MFNSHRLIAQTVVRTWGAVISKTSKTAPNLAQKPAKIREKVAETAEILKTAPKTQPKSQGKPEKK